MFNLDEYKIDKIKIKGEEFIGCKSRKKLIKVTPEEEVRQKVIEFLQKEINVPEKMLEVEFPLSRIESGNKLRVDIVVFEEIDNKKAPLLVIECKEPKIPLCNGVYEQLREYDEVLEPKYIAMTNGIDIYIEKYKEDDNEFLKLEKIPKYSDMLLNKGQEIIEEQKWIRCNEEDYDDIEFLLECYYPLITEHIDDKEKIEIIKFIDSLYDTSVRLENCGNDLIYIEKDNGNLNKSFGNSSGDGWNGLYRIFLVKYKENYYTISLGVNLGYILVGIEDNTIKHHSLQLRLTKSTFKKIKNGYQVIHSGRMTVGNKGSVKNQIVLDYIKEKCPRILNDNRIILGDLKLDKDSKITDIKDFIFNLIEYSLLRDEIREIEKQS